MKKNILMIAIQIVALGVIPLLTVQTSWSQEQQFEWNNIVPLTTRKLEVEQSLGKPFHDNNYSSIFVTRSGIITVSYVSSKVECNWERAADTVHSFNVSFSKRIPVTALGFDLRQFERKEDNSEFFSYLSEETGRSFSTNKVGEGIEEVRSIRFGPSASEEKRRCVQEEQDRETWREFTPLKTTKSEVEKLLGKPFYESGYISGYDTKLGKVTVWFTGAKDPEGVKCNWGVPVDTVHSFSVSLRKRAPISTLGYDLKQFERQESNPELFGYISRETGISFSTNKTDAGIEEVFLIHLRPSAEQEERRCRVVSEKLPSRS